MPTTITLEDITDADIEAALKLIRSRVNSKKRGREPFCSIAESFGKLSEEFSEAAEAAHDKDPAGYRDELVDIGYVIVRSIAGHGKAKREDPR